MIPEDMRALAIRQIAGVPHVRFTASAIASDVTMFTRSFPDPQDFANAVASTVAVLRKLATRPSFHGVQLTRGLYPWFNLHYQHVVANGQRADMRLIYMRTPDGMVHVLAFGHRHIPLDIYHRVLDGMRTTTEAE